MPIELKMPALSPTMEEGTLARWLVGVGDEVKPGDVLAEIETDKATMEFESVDEGRISAILAAEGTDGVPVGTVIATLATKDEVATADTRLSVAKPCVGPEPAKADVNEAKKDVAPSPTPPLTNVPVRPSIHPSDQSSARASTMALRIAAARGIDLDTVQGSGPGGLILRGDLPPASSGSPIDVEPAARSANATDSAPSAIAVTPSHDVPDVPHEMIKLSGMRRTIARRLTESKQQVPHIYLSVDVRVDALMELRSRLNEAIAPRGEKLSINDMVIRALGLALTDVPSCNVQFAGDRSVQFRRVDVSVAVSIPNGLITPIIRNVEGKSLSRISAEMRELSRRAREGRLQPSEYEGGTASLSNLGMLGISQFSAVINPPQAMILAVGAAVVRPRLEAGMVVPETVMTTTGSFDHRVIDGADAASLMQAFRRIVEGPMELL